MLNDKDELNELKKRVAALEVQVQKQPEEIAKKVLKEIAIQLKNSKNCHHDW